MARRMLMTLIVVLLLIAISALVVNAGILQSVRDSFCASNPNNGWEYGYVDKGGGFIPYNTTFDDGKGIAGWAYDYSPGPLGDVTINYTDQPIRSIGIYKASIKRKNTQGCFGI